MNTHLVTDHAKPETASCVRLQVVAMWDGLKAGTGSSKDRTPPGERSA